MALGRRPSLDTGGLDALPTGLKGTWEIQKRYTGYNLAYEIGKDLGVGDKKGENARLALCGWGLLICRGIT